AGAQKDKDNPFGLLHAGNGPTTMWGRNSRQSGFGDSRHSSHSCFGSSREGCRNEYSPLGLQTTGRVDVEETSARPLSGEGDDGFDQLFRIERFRDVSVIAGV